ncbi:MAG: inositol monophosphatase [Lachnospiraceae bacterium]|nr:inositol monophosphatase [Lachnospiraceae bacterium]
MKRKDNITVRETFVIQDIIELLKRTRSFVQNREMAGHIKVKGPADYVTQVDTDIQNFLFQELGRLAPEIQFLGEEEGLHEMSGETYWILDPIDGTTNLIHDYQHSVVSLGLYDKGEITLGVIYDPFREDIYYAQKGKGSFLNGAPIHVSEAKTLGETIVTIGTSPYDRELTEANFRRFQRVFEKSQDIRRTGSAALDLAYLACGRTGGFFESLLSPWDFAAGMLLVTEAGGQVTDYAGEPLNLLQRGSVVATNGKVHEELRGLLNV